MTYKYSKKSLDRLHSCHPDLQLIFKYVIAFIDCSIIFGHRTREEQELAFINGNTQLHFPHSKHNSSPSMAADAAPYPIDWKDIPRFKYFSGIVLGIAKTLKIQGLVHHDVRWGGDWDMDHDMKDQNFNDLLHFELVGD